MDFLNDLTEILRVEPWWRFAVALLIGALIGLEREFKQQQRKGGADFAGLRTFSFISLFGSIGAFLYKDYGIIPGAIAFAGLILLIVASHAAGVVHRSGKGKGTTTEIAALITFLLGWMVVEGEVGPAVGLAVIVAFLLALKPKVTSTVRTMDWDELRTVLQFGLVTAVILPLLPNRQYGPFEALNPFRIWLLVVFISGIGFAGYLLMKLLGAEKGVGLAALLGGMASSTATTVGFSGRSKQMPALSDVLARGILLASSVMFPRVLLEVVAINPALVRLVIVPIGSMLVAGAIMVAWMWQRNKEEARPDDIDGVKVSNPLKLSTALVFAAAFTVVVIAVEIMEDQLGDAGVYITSVIAALTDVNAITLSLSQVARSGVVEPRVAAAGIVIASITNTAVKAVIAWALGSAALRRMIVLTFGVIVLVGLVSGALALFILPPAG